MAKVTGLCAGWPYSDEQYKKLLIELHGVVEGTKGFELWLEERKKKEGEKLPIKRK